MLDFQKCVPPPYLILSVNNEKWHRIKDIKCGSACCYLPNSGDPLSFLLLEQAGQITQYEFIITLQHSHQLFFFYFLPITNKEIFFMLTRQANCLPDGQTKLEHIY